MTDLTTAPAPPRTKGARLFELNRTITTPEEYRELLALDEELVASRARELEAEYPRIADRAELTRLVRGLLAEEEASPPECERIMAEELSREQFREVVRQFAVDGLTESESFLPIVPRLPKKAKMAVFRVLVDEFGCGNLDQAHFNIYRELMSELDLSLDVEDYLGTTNPETFAYVNLFFWAAARAPRPEYFLGALCYLESSILYAFRCFADAATRLGLAGARYYTEHLHIDHFHAKELSVAIRELEAEADLDCAKVWAGFRLASETIGGSVEAAVASALRGGVMAAPDRADGPVPAPARPRTAVTDGAPVVEAAGEDEVRVRVGEREFLVSAACPHRRGRLVFARVNEARLRITCPLHHSSFDLLTGAALSGPTERPLCVREVTGDQPPR